MFEVFDGAVREAAASMGTHCNQRIAVTGPACGEELAIGIVDRPNLLCDRTLVGTCPDGHQHLVSVIDDME